MMMFFYIFVYCCQSVQIPAHAPPMFDFGRPALPFNYFQLPPDQQREIDAVMRSNRPDMPIFYARKAANKHQKCIYDMLQDYNNVITETEKAHLKLLNGTYFIEDSLAASLAYDRMENMQFEPSRYTDATIGNILSDRISHRGGSVRLLRSSGLGDGSRRVIRTQGEGLLLRWVDDHADLFHASS